MFMVVRLIVGRQRLRAGCGTGAPRPPVIAGDGCRRACSRRAEVRKPVWATIRWSGRTAWPSTCQLRWSTSIVSAIPKPWVSRPCRKVATWVMDGR